MSSRYDIVSLKLFIAICEERSIAKAAEREHMAASAISKRLSDLEATARNELIYRRSSGLEPTPAGVTLLHHARTILKDLALLDSELKGFSRGTKGQVRVHANSWASSQYLPRDLATFMAANRDIIVNLEQSVSSTALHTLRDRNADIAIIGGDYLMPGFRRIPYHRDRWVLITPEQHELQGIASAKFKDILHLAFVGLQKGSAIDTVLVREAAQHGGNLKVRIRVSGFELGAMVEAGLGVGVVPRLRLDRYFTRMKLNVVELEDDWADRELVICHVEGEQPTAATRLLIEHLSDAAGQATISGLTMR